MITKRKGPRILTRVRRLMRISGRRTSILALPKKRPLKDEKIGRVIIVTHDIRCNGLLLTVGQLAIVTQAQRDWYNVIIDPGYPGWTTDTPAFLTYKDFKFAGKRIQNAMKDRVISVVSNAVEDNLKAMQIIGAIYGKEKKGRGKKKK